MCLCAGFILVKSVRNKCVSFFSGTALVLFFICHILQAVYLCGIQLNIAILFKAYIVV